MFFVSLRRHELRGYDSRVPLNVLVWGFLLTNRCGVEWILCRHSRYAVSR